MAKDSRKKARPYTRKSPKAEIEQQIAEQKALENAEIEEANAMLEDFFEKEYVYRAPDEIYEDIFFDDFSEHDDDDDFFLDEDEEDWYLDLSGF